MMWRVLHDRVEGLSHRRMGSACQDSYHVLQLTLEGEQLLVLACADGAGTASASGVGAKLACEAATDCASEFLNGGGRPQILVRDTFVQWIQQARIALEGEAERQQIPLHEMACTLLLAVVAQQGAAYLQIGDGAIVIADQGGYHPVFWPDTGEYHNTTYFVTDANVDEHLHTHTTSDVPDEIALFTDGLQMLALDYAKRMVHEPFFRPLFKSLRDAPDPNELVEAMRHFLDSEAVNARTDDDKTLILAAKAPRHGDDSF